MLRYIQIFTHTAIVTMQVKRAIGKAILHKLPIYNEFMCLCSVSTLFCMICGCFPIVVKALLHDFDRYIKRLTCVVNMPRSYVPVLLAMQSCVASRSAFYRGQRYIYE